MFSRLLGKYEDIPLPPEKRNRTDIPCCILTSILALAMFVFALVTYIQLGIYNQDSAPINSTPYFSIPPHLFNPSSGSITSFDYNGFIWTIITSTICCFGIGIFWMAIVQIIPTILPKLAIVLAFMALVTIAVFSFILHNE